MELALRQAEATGRSRPASRLGAATEAERAVAPMPASTAARTASFDGISITMCKDPGAMPKAASAVSNAERVPDPGSRSTQSPAASSSVGERGALGPGMIGPDDDDELVARHGPAVEQGAFHDPLDEAQLHRAVLDGGGDLLAVADQQAELDLRVGAAEGDEMARQPVAGDGLARLHRERPALQPADLAERQRRRLDPRQHRPRLAEEQPAGIGQRDAASDPVE